MTFTTQAFPLGYLSATPQALLLVRGLGRTPDEFIDRHSRGDWGDLDEEGKALNDHAMILNEGRLLSSYRLSSVDSLKDLRIWVITEADRSATTILLPEEY